MGAGCSANTNKEDSADTVAITSSEYEDSVQASVTTSEENQLDAEIAEKNNEIREINRLFARARAAGEEKKILTFRVASSVNHCKLLESELRRVNTEYNTLLDKLRSVQAENMELRVIHQHVQDSRRYESTA